MKSVWPLLAFTNADVWHGEENIAILENIGGGSMGTQNTGIENLFDEDFDSFFASDSNTTNDPDKHLLITFHVSDLLC